MVDSNAIPTAPLPEPAPRFAWLNHPLRIRILLGGSAIGCFCIFWWAGALCSVPGDWSASLLQSSPTGLLIALVLLVICSALATAVAGTVRADAGLFCAAFGLSALSCRDGSIRATLVSAHSPSILLVLAAELFLLYLGLIACWMVIQYLAKRGLVQSESALDGLADDEEITLGQKLSALGAQVVVMLFVVWVLCPYDAKNQCLAAVAIGGWAGAAASHYFQAPVRPSLWYWGGPLLVGAAGYILSYANPAGWELANLHGTFAPLARPLPLDYASFGVAGSLAGYWMSRRWRRENAAAQ